MTATLTNKTPRNIKSAAFGALTINSAHVGWSEIIVADVDTRNMRYGTCYPTADGTHTDGTGTYADIDESGVTDANSIILAAAGDRQSWSVTKHGAHGGGAITAVVLNGLIASDGTNDMQASIRIGGVDYDSADLGLTAAAEGKSVVFNTRPDTSAGWGTTDITALEFGYEAVAP